MLCIFILSLSLNTHAQEESKNFEKEVKDYIEGKTESKPKFLKTDNAISDKKIQEINIHPNAKIKKFMIGWY